MKKRLIAWWCSLTRHAGEHTILEEYSRADARSLFLVTGSIITKAPHIRTTIACKSRCNRCGAVITGNLIQRRWS